MNNRKNTLYHLIYGIMLATVIFMVTWAYMHYDGPATIEECFSDPIDFSEGWVDESGEAVNTSKLHTIKGVVAGEEFSIYRDIPGDLAEGQYLCFRSKNVFLKAYIDGELVYDPYIPESIMYTKSMGTRWHYISIPEETAGS